MLVLDAPQARAERRGQRDIGIDVGGGDPVLDALRLLASPGMTRSAQVRFSTPQVASVGAQKPGIRRV